METGNLQRTSLEICMARSIASASPSGRTRTSFSGMIALLRSTVQGVEGCDDRTRHADFQARTLQNSQFPSCWARQTARARLNCSDHQVADARHISGGLSEGAPSGRRQCCSGRKTCRKEGVAAMAIAQLLSRAAGRLPALCQSCAHRKRGKQLVKRDRVVPYTSAARVVDRIGDRGAGAADPEFADALLLRGLDLSSSSARKMASMAGMSAMDRHMVFGEIVIDEVAEARIGALFPRAARLRHRTPFRRSPVTAPSLRSGYGRGDTPSMRRRRTSPVSMSTPTSAKCAPVGLLRGNPCCAAGRISPVRVHPAPQVPSTFWTVLRMRCYHRRSGRLRDPCRQSVPAFRVAHCMPRTRTEPELPAPHDPPEPGDSGKLVSPSSIRTCSIGRPSISAAICRQMV